MTLPRHHNPVRLITALTGLVALVAVVASPALRSLPWLSAPQTGAIGGYDAVHVIGPSIFTGATGDNWEDIFIPSNAFVEFAFDATDQVIYGVTSFSALYSCDAAATECDEEADWISHSLGSFTLESLVLDPASRVLYAGSNQDPAAIYRCDIVATGCDDTGDWTTSLTVNMFAGAEHAAALEVAGGTLFAGFQAFFNDHEIYSCDLSVEDCADAGDWIVANSGGGGRITELFHDSANDVVYAGYTDNGSGSIERCDMTTGCDADLEWVGAGLGGIGGVNDFTVDEANGILYVAFANASDEGGPVSDGGVARCDTADGCDDAGDWSIVFGGEAGEEDTTGASLIWDSVTEAVYLGDTSTSRVYRCLTATGCDDPAEWVVASTAAGRNAFIIDTTDDVIYSGGDSLYRCDTATGCALFNELDNTYGVAYDETGQRLFVSDHNQNRVVMYDFSDGLTDGEEPVNVLGQAGLFSGTECNRGAGPGEAGADTLCQPVELAYDGTNDRLFVGDFSNNRVLVFDMSGAVTDGMAAAYVLGQPDFVTEDCETDQTSVCENQAGMAYDAANERLFVGDLYNQRVMVFDVDPGTIADGAPAINVIGVPDFTTAPGACTTGQATTCSPYGVTLDGDNQLLFVADGSVHRVTVFDVDPAVLVPGCGLACDGPLALNVLGQTDFTSTGFGTTSTTMLNPSGLAYDSTEQRLFVADAGNHRVLQFDTTAIVDGEAAVDVYGQDDLSSGTSGTTQSSLFAPYTVTYMSADNYVAVADTENNRILFFDAVSGGGSAFGHTAIDVIGQTDAGGAITYVEGDANNSLQPSEFGFDRPKGVAFDAVGHRMFVADTENNRVLVFNLTVGNELAEYSADAVLGQADFVENGVGIGAAGMEAPMNMLYDENDDRLFVTDTKNNRVLIFDGSDGITTGEAAVGVLGQADFAGEAAVVSQTGMSLPGGLAYDPIGQRLFVAEDEGGRVLVFDLDDGIDDDFSDGEAAVNVLGKPDFNTGGASGGGASAACYHIRGIAYIPSLLAGDDALFIADHDCQRVMVFNVEAVTDGEAAVNVLGAPDFVSAPYTAEARSTETANGVAYDADSQRLFVQSLEYGRITVFDLSDGITDGEAAVNVLGAPDFSTLTSGTTRSQLSFGDDDFGLDDLHGGIAYVPGTDKLYTADTANHRIMVFDVATIVNGEDAESTVGHTDGGVTFSFGSVSANNSPIRDGLDRPVNVALDAVHHRLFVGDYDNARVLVYELTANDWREDYIPDFVLGQPDFSSSGSSLSAAGFASRPEQMAYDATNDRLFVLDDNGRVLIYDTATIVNGEAAVNVLGKPDFTTDYDGSATPTNIGYPAGLAYDEANERLFVTDWDAASRVVVWDLSGGITDGASASWVLGRPDLSTGGSGLSDTEMGGPVKLAYDPVNQRLFVDDFEYERILVFDVTTIVNGEAAVNVLGKPDFTTEGAGTSATEVSGGWGMDYDETNERLFYADYSSNRIMVWDFTDGITDGMAATDLYGQTSFSEGASGLSDTELNNPNGVFYDETHSRLYVADTDNHRVLVFGSPPTGSSDNNPSPPQIGFTPLRIEVNDEEVETNSRNVLVKVFATSTDTFTGTVDILLSNDPRFATFIPFRYVIPERRGNQTTRDIWPKTMAWDLCFGLEDPDDCDPGRKVVYARFYVNVPAPTPQLLPTPETAIEHPDEP